MPLFEYTCDECSTNFELLIRGNETPTCPLCQSTLLDRKFSIPVAHTGGDRTQYDLPIAGSPCGMGGCGRPECEI